MKKINETNYFENTKAQFRFLAELNREDVLIYSKYSQAKADIKYLQWKIAKLLNVSEVEVKPNFNSTRNFCGSVNSSLYFVVGDKLVRVSDHWSKTNKENIYSCGWIRSCFWELNAFKKDLKITSKSKRPFAIGITKFNKMERIQTI